MIQRSKEQERSCVFVSIIIITHARCQGFVAEVFLVAGVCLGEKLKKPLENEKSNENVAKHNVVWHARYR
jgi:hypothetical protein